MSGGSATDFRLLAESTADIIGRLAPDLTVVYLSRSVFNVLGWTPDELVGKPPSSIVLEEDLPVMAAVHAYNLTRPARSRTASVRMRRKDGSLVWMEVSAGIVRDPQSEEVREVVVVMRDISELKAREEALSALARTDALTGLGNRRAFDEVLKREWLRTLREGSQLSLVMLDLDHFKELNDTYGHQAGDDCLREVADAIRATIRATDTPCRYGGEEIAIILPSSDEAGAVRVAEAVRVAIEVLDLPHEGTERGADRLTASVGVATAHARHGATMPMPAGLILAADNALYDAKDRGRNRLASALLGERAGR